MFKDIFIDKRVKGTKCEGCLFSYNAYDASLPCPCDRCINRPSRRHDKSEFIPDFTPAERAAKRTESEVDY